MKQENRPDILDPNYLNTLDPETLILCGVEKLKLDYEETIAKQAEQIAFLENNLSLKTTVMGHLKAENQRLKKGVSILQDFIFDLGEEESVELHKAQQAIKGSGPDAERTGK